MPQHLKLNKTQFKTIAIACKRWSDRSINVAQSLFVDDIDASEVAKKYKMSVQQVHVIKNRFIGKIEKSRIESFMAREKPKLAETSLEPFKKDIKILRKKGYTSEQILAFLKENDVNVSLQVVNNFFKESP